MNLLPTLLGFLFGLLLIVLAGAWLSTLAIKRKVETLLPPKGRFVDVPGARLHVREYGEGPAILMIHGLGGQLAHFGYALAPQLAGRFRVVAVDRPGSGWSTATGGTGSPGSADLGGQAAALAALIERLALGRPLVVGHSLGGAVALRLALDHPDKVSGLALLAPLTHMPDGVPDVFRGLTIRSPLLRKLVAWTLATPSAIGKSAQTLAQVFGPDAVPKDFGMRGAGLLSLRPAAYLAASADLQALPAVLPAQQARYGALRLPLGILFGRGDRILDCRFHGQALADAVPGARLELIDGGHMLPVTHPDACTGFIEAMARASGLTRDGAQSAVQ
jgi:pimeloyl-ACP methyl ester carboxylesterase